MYFYPENPFDHTPIPEKCVDQGHFRQSDTILEYQKNVASHVILASLVDSNQLLQININSLS